MSCVFSGRRYHIHGSEIVKSAWPRERCKTGMEKDLKDNLYEFEISRFQELLKDNREYAFQRYGWTLFYSLPPEQTFLLKNELGWKGNDPLDYYNLGALECQKGNLKEALKHFEKAESLGCGAPELFFNLAAIHEEQQDRAKAKAYYQKYIDAAESWDEIPKSLQRELDEIREYIKKL
ncbi:MAG TPA: tetratricopeptide repeat protein [bacterium]|nr:tetratricopeptide repeat protein [bacterium]